MSGNHLVLGLAGFTKSLKSELARSAQEFTDLRIHEMSEPIYELLEPRCTVADIFHCLDGLRAAGGSDFLAKRAVEKIKSQDGNWIVAGLRSIDDHLFLRGSLSNYRLVVIHSSRDLRHQRLLGDPTSIAKTYEEFQFMDRRTLEQGFRELVADSDYLLIHDKGYPLTPMEQFKLVMVKLASELNVEISWNKLTIDGATLVPLKEASMIQDGVHIWTLPTFEEDAPEGASPIHRVLKSKGELANLSVSPTQYVAYVTFPADGQPRANHYHNEKIEYLYLAKGKVTLHFRRASSPESPVEQRLLEAGCLVCIEPGWTHAFVTEEEGYAIEFSPTAYEIIANDKFKDRIVG